MSYKEWRVVDQTLEEASYIVRIDFNDTEGAPGTCYYGPFSKEDADDFCQNFDEDDQELDDAYVIFLNKAETVYIEE